MKTKSGPPLRTGMLKALNSPLAYPDASLGNWVYLKHRIPLQVNFPRYSGSATRSQMLTVAETLPRSFGRVAGEVRFKA